MPPKKKKSSKKTHGEKYKSSKRKQKRNNSGNKSKRKRKRKQKSPWSYIDLSKGSDDSPSIIAELRQYAEVGKQEYPKNPSLKVVNDEELNIFEDLSPINPDIMTPPMRSSINSNNQKSNFNKRLSFEDDDDDVDMTGNDSPPFRVVDESWTRVFGGKRKKRRKRTRKRKIRKRKRKTKRKK